MTKKSKKTIKIIALVTLIAIAGGVIYGIYMYNLPHRNVQTTNTDYKVTVSELVNEYLSDPETANKKYLADDGDSKVLEVTGTVKRIQENFNGQKVIILQQDEDQAGASFTITTASHQDISTLETGQTITLKGVIRSGPFYDADLDMYVNAVIDESDLVI